MIHVFPTDKNTLFFPTKWANSVANWLLNLMSPDGSIRIVNTPEPTDMNGCKIEVDVEAIYPTIRDRIMSELNQGKDDEEIDKDISEEGEGTGGYDPLVCIPQTNESGVLTGFTFAKMSTIGAGASSLDAFDMQTYELPSASGGNYGAVPITDNGGNVTGIKFGTEEQIADNSEQCKTVTLQGTPLWCVKPTVGAGGVITALTFGTEGELNSGTGGTTLNLSSLGGSGSGSGSGAYAVKPTFDANGVLQKLEFGSEANITAKYDGAALVASTKAAWEAAVEAYNANPTDEGLQADMQAKLTAYQNAQTAVSLAESAIQTVNTVVGCPYKP